MTNSPNPISPQSKAPEPANPVNHEWVRNVIDACTSGNSHGNHAGGQVLCHRVAFQINKHFGLENRRWNTDGDPERDADFIDPYPHGDYFEEVKRHHATNRRVDRQKDHRSGKRNSPMTTDPSSPALTPGDHIERLRAMAFDHGETWDLSDNDQAAIRWALFKLTEPEKQEEEKL